MAKRPRGDGEKAPANGPKPGASSLDAGSVRKAQSALADVARTGRAEAGNQSDGLLTSRTGAEGGSPVGHPTRIPRRADAAVQRSIARENSGAVAVAADGYEIKQNPTPDEVAQARRAAGDLGKFTSRPDYLIEGRVFDCYSPDDGKPVRGIWSEVADKVENGQTQRVIVNLEDWSGDLAALRRQFMDWPVEGLKEVKVIIQGGGVAQIDLPPASE